MKREFAPEEEWRPIPGHEGQYEVSSLGGVRSVDRVVNLVDGRVRKFFGQDIAIQLDKRGYRVVCLKVANKTCRRFVHRLMGLAFISNPQGLPVVRHLNDCRLDNRLENLAWGTYADNNLDAVKNGVHPESTKTHCPRGHEYNEANTYLYDHNSRPGFNRQCRPCRKINLSNHYKKKRRASEG